MFNNMMLIIQKRFAAWLIGITNTLPLSPYGGWQTSTFRQVIAANILAYSGSKIRITFKGDAARLWNVDEVYINHAATSGNEYSFVGTPTQVTFSGGSAGFALAAGGSITSDDITFAFDKTKKFVIAIDWANSGNLGCAANTSATNWTAYYIYADDAQTVTASGYTQNTTTIAGVLEIEVFA